MPSAISGSITAQDLTAEHLLIFQLGGGSFGLRLGAVAEIVRVPVLARMPLVPPSLLGLANLRGIVLPVVSLRQLLHLPDATPNELTRMIVIHGGAPVGFVVDRVDHLLAVPPDQLEKDDAGAGAFDPAMLEGVIKGAEGESTIKILNPQRLIRGQFEQLGVLGARDATGTSISIGASGVAGSTEQRTQVALVNFELGQQEYALPLTCVREIIPLPDHVSEVPHSETAVLGVVTLRERLLPLVSLRALLGLSDDIAREHRGKVIVVSMGDGAIGVVADATREILRVDPNIIDPAPALLTRGEGDAEITSICRLDQGRRLVALLSPDRLFRSDVVRRILAEQTDGTNASDAATEANAMAAEQFIIFRLGDQEYGMPIAAVGEIARPPERITRLPKAPAFIDGVMNLRGVVVPIVDLRRRFDLVAKEQEGSQRILVLEVTGVRAGFIVDSVSEVMKVSIEAICPAPELSPDQMRLISRIVNLESNGRIILLVDPAQLLDQVETDILGKFEQSELDHAATAQ
jgi:purine-binding chemotaxis protein CheW